MQFLKRYLYDSYVFEEDNMKNVILSLPFFLSLVMIFIKCILQSDPNNASCYLCKWNEIICFRAVADECVLELPWFQIFWITYSITRISQLSLKEGLHTFILLNSKNCSDLYLKVQVTFCGYS